MNLQKYSRYEVCFKVDHSSKFVLDTDSEAALAERDEKIKELENRVDEIKHYALAHSDHYLVDICDGKKET